MQRLDELLVGADVEVLVGHLKDIDQEGVDPWREVAMDLVGRHFAKKFPVEAFRMATDPATEDFCSWGLLWSMISMVRDSPELVLSEVRRVSDDHQQRQAMNQLVSIMWEADPSVLRSWLEEPDVKAAVGMDDLLKGLAAKSPADAGVQGLRTRS